ncbi:hypothetical protein [Providencia stuartii]|uniref:hypothetical protein n=1 Tax=Providencia stuartii TaxID=588 RepID=UPI00076B0433|nr:hypothetical protein [Providencia stuartii]AMG66533.1 hypothetical protein AL507_08040 [Providencia stuartii]
MNQFDSKLLKPVHAVIYKDNNCAEIKIMMKPFLWCGDLIDTSLVMNNVSLPSLVLRELAGSSFDFRNDDIDASIYIDHAHHPVDIKSIKFVLSRHDDLTIVIAGTYIFEHEGLANAKNSEFILSTKVSSCFVG